MEIIEFVLLSGTVWIIVLLLDFSSSQKHFHSIAQRLGTRLFSSFWVGLLLHLTTFCIFYGALIDLVIQLTQAYIHPVITLLSWGAGGVTFAANVVRWMRMRTDDTWLLRRWLLQDLKEAEDPRAHLEALVVKIQSDPERDSSRRALSVLRELAMRGDSLGATVHRVLSEHDLL